MWSGVKRGYRTRFRKDLGIAIGIVGKMLYQYRDVVSDDVKDKLFRVYKLLKEINELS